MPQDRNEHLAWAKRRALEYANMGDLPSAVTSMLSDLGKHDAFRNNPTYAIVGAMGLQPAMKGDRAEVIRWIEGFN